MALPTSGALSMRDIADELGISPNTSLTLAGMSGTAGFSDPDSISEFYGYSAVTLTSFTGSTSYGTALLACGRSTGVTYYHDGAGTFPVVNDNIYTDSSGASALANGFYFSSSPADHSFRIVSGVLNSYTNCR